MTLILDIRVIPSPLRYRTSLGNRAPLGQTRSRQIIKAHTDEGRQDHHQVGGNGDGEGNHRPTELGVLEQVDTGQGLDLAAELLEGTIFIRL